MKIAIIEFSVENFKIFRDRATLSMASRKSDHTFEIDNESLLKTSLIYGPNASGKTTTLEAFRFFRHWIISSSDFTDEAIVEIEPFLLSDESKSKSTKFELVFSLDQEIYKYGFSVLGGKITQESLCEVLKSGEKEYLTRNENGTQVFSKLKSHEDVIEKTRENVLFLSAAAKWNNSLALNIVEAIKNQIHVMSGFCTHGGGSYTARLAEENIEKKEKILKYLKVADFCIEDIEVTEKNAVPNPGTFFEKNGVRGVARKLREIFLFHKVFNSNGEETGLSKINMHDESNGTQQFFFHIGPIIDTLEKGLVLFIDEFDNSLHPKLTKFIVDLFEKNNPKNAQLIVTTHDTSLLSYKDEFIKDQFWFTDKDKFGAGKLYSMAEFEIRNNTEFSKKYLEGRFGALPIVGSLD